MIQCYFISWIFVHRTFILGLGLIYMCIKRYIYEKCTLLGYYGANSGNFLPKFRDNYRSPDVGKKSPLLTA